MRSNEIFSNDLDSINNCLHLDLVGGVVMDWLVGVSDPSSYSFWYSLFKQTKMKQTAVEWLVEQMIERKFFAKNAPLSYTTLEHLTNQAKAMEKEQMLDFFCDGLLDVAEDDLTFDDYFNEKFKAE